MDLKQKFHALCEWFHPTPGGHLMTILEELHARVEAAEARLKQLEEKALESVSHLFHPDTSEGAATTGPLTPKAPTPFQVPAGYQELPSNLVPLSSIAPPGPEGSTPPVVIDPPPVTEAASHSE